MPSNGIVSDWQKPMMLLVIVLALFPIADMLGSGFYFSPKSNLSAAVVVDPNITVRCANPTMNCTTYELCVDVEFQSDIANKELFGMNVRFFIDDKIKEFVAFRNFQGGYSAVTPNPANVSYSTSGIPWFNFTGGADYVNGAIQKTNSNATPIYISTSGWTKLFQMCFIVDSPNGDETHYCPPIVWDLESDPANGGFPSGSAGVVMTVVNGSGSANALEHVDQFNWQYTGNGAAPFGEPIEESCANVDCGSCNLTVNTTADSGTGSLRACLQCAYSGDTIKFASNLAGQTITISSARLNISKDLVITSNLSPKVKITSSTSGLFDIFSNTIVEFKNMDITSGTNFLEGSIPAGAAFRNAGNLKLTDVKVFKNSALATNQYLIRNKTNSIFSTSGACFIEIP
jgi:hypothetical protein